MIKFFCPRCHHSLRVPYALANRTARCCCGTPVRVPPLRYPVIWQPGTLSYLGLATCILAGVAGSMMLMPCLWVLALPIAVAGLVTGFFGCLRLGPRTGVLDMAPLLAGMAICSGVAMITSGFLFNFYFKLAKVLH